MAALDLHFMFYNFVKIHGTLRTSPAMAAGVTDKLWELSGIVTLVEQAEQESSDSNYGEGGTPKRSRAK